MRRFPRRRFLAAFTGAIALPSSAGCTSSEDTETPTNGGTGDEDESTESPESETGTDSTTGTAGESDSQSETETETESELDLEEANVVEVAFEETDGQYTFDVTLHHDDDGEDGYANWWQVEQFDGTQLGRRELLHAHSQQPFTRSETIEIQSDVTCVVVRGHDKTHGYGGQLMLVNLDSGESRAVSQGTEKQSFAEDDCP